MQRLVRSTLGFSILATLLLAMITAGEPLAHGYWNVSYWMYSRPAPRSDVLVTLDDTSTWGTADEAELLERIQREMPRRIVFDAQIPAGKNPKGDAALADTIRSLGNDILFVARSAKVDQFATADFKLPPRSIIGKSTIALSAWHANFLYFADSSPGTISLNDGEYPVLSSELAGIPAVWDHVYPDFSIDPATVVQIPASHVHKGQVPPGLLTGRTVIVTAAAQAPPILYKGHGLVPPIMLDIAGAEGLKKPFAWGFAEAGSLPLLMLIVLLVAAGGRSTGWRKFGFYAAAVVASFVLPFLFRSIGIVLAPDTSWMCMAIYGAVRLWSRRTRRIQLTSASGLPNLLALSSAPIPIGSDVVVGIVARYEEILATLPRELHHECARQIARRITSGASSSTIYHGEGGHFAWIEEARPIEVQFGHLEGLRALFSAPLQIGSHTFDTNIHFGLDRNEGLDASTRVNSALASASEALANGRVIELFEADRLAEAPWELSLHARIEEGLRNGDIWLAYQPQWDLRANRICGAEALIRWNHPTRGPIAPDAFILQAERAGRIDALTYWVLDLAIASALALNARGPRLQMSINLSAQMVDKPDLVQQFAAIVARRGIDPALLTVEVTETSSVRNRPAACHNLSQLRALGFRLSIDDFGTGEASLAYLADLPSDELKIDRRFVSRMADSPRDRVIVSNTISLAHALGQSVVAEGVEDAETCALLTELGCDQAQGYYLGRPQPFDVFEADYLATLEKRSQMF